MYMQGQKSRLSNLTGGGWFKRELKFLVVFLGLISFLNLIFSHNSFALYTPTLSASVNQANLQINGNQVINSVSQTSELPIQVTVNTNNRTGYTATLNTETDETALVNTTSTSGAKINSIDTNKTLTNFSENTWGFLSSTSGNYQPIPSLSNSINLYSTAAKTSGNENFDFKIGMKLSSNLENGSYTNKLVVSIISNQYEKRALMTTGINFNTKLKTFETGGNKIEHIMRSATASSFGANTVSLEDEANSDYEIKAWYDSVTKTAYYYTEAEKIFLNDDSNAMFYNLVNLTSLDVSSFDTSKVRGMGNMFFGDEKLTTLDLSNFDTSKVEDMAMMFAETHKLKTLNLGHLNTSRVTTMEKMFNNMWALENLDVSSFDTSNVTNMKDMFNGVTKITTLNLNNFNTSNVTDMSNMFNSMLAIENLSLPSFDTRRVTTMRSMFATMEGLKNLNISSFDTSNVRDFRYMFGLGDVQNYGYDQIDHLEHIYASKKFVISAMETGGSGGIFHRRPSLMVGAGCTYVSGTGNPFCIGSTWVVVP